MLITLALFFASGMYEEKVRYARRWVIRTFCALFCSIAYASAISYRR